MNPIAISFPRHEADREKLRALVRDIPGFPGIPRLYPHGVERPCTKCKMPLDVGPRVAAALSVYQEMRLLCPWCGFTETAGTLDKAVLSLGSPDSKGENEP